MLDFAELPATGRELELLIRELLFLMGYPAYWSGVGQDAGKDLICHEIRDSIFDGRDGRTWLVQCKHFANSGKAVSISDLDDIVDSCTQHDAKGYLLCCSTYPSSKVIARLAGITANKTNSIIAAYWDAIKIEQFLTTPKLWPLAQRFFPISANADGLKLYGTDSPNHWVANCRGYYFHVANRIGSNVEMHIQTILDVIKKIESRKLPKDHLVRIRAVYYDDKHSTYRWYLDYLIPSNVKAIAKVDSPLQTLQEEIWQDGQIHVLDILERQYYPDSDHYDKDHYDYYIPYIKTFLFGGERRP